MGLTDRAFRALTRMLPAEFRGEYERKMSATFHAQRRDAHGALGLTRIWVATLVDVFRTAPANNSIFCSAILATPCGCWHGGRR
jgi:hypothetical protein